MATRGGSSGTLIYGVLIFRLKPVNSPNMKFFLQINGVLTNQKQSISLCFAMSVKEKHKLLKTAESYVP